MQKLTLSAEMIQAELMIEHNTIVVHAIRLNGGERQTIIRQMALACYNYQVLTYKSKNDTV
jgi:metal-dependent amidase/aminoacylase/carboxypeptidase family protein